MSVPAILSIILVLLFCFQPFLVQQRAEREHRQISTLVNEVLNDLLYIIQCRHTDSKVVAAGGMGGGGNPPTVRSVFSSNPLANSPTQYTPGHKHTN